MNLGQLVKLVAIASCVLSVASCSKKSAEYTQIDGMIHPKDTIRVDVGAEPPTFDPTLSEDTTSTRIMYDLFAGLVDFNQQNNPIPGMANSWNISSDGKIYTFNLRKDLKFSDGSPITANDFVYSWQRLADPKTASPYSTMLVGVLNADKIINSKLNKKELGVQAKDNYTFVVNLEYPDPYFIYKIMLPNFSVVPQKTINKYGNIWTNPDKIVTSGAYVLKEHVINGYSLAVKNPYYYDNKNVKIGQVKYIPYQDMTTTVQTYKSGGIDLTFMNVPLDLYDSLKKIYASQVHTVSQEGIVYYDINMKDPIFANNVKLRKALSMAIDRETLTKNVIRQGQPPLYSYITPTVDNGAYKDIVYDWAILPQSTKNKQAQQLLKEAGYSATNRLKFSISYNTNDLNKRVALALTSMWKSVFGNAIQITNQNQEWKTFLQSRHNANYQIARDGWSADYNGVTAYTMLYECNNSQNNSHYCNPKYNELVNQAKREVDTNKRTQIFKQAIQLAMNDYAIIPLYQYTYTEMIKPYVIGYNPDNNHLEHIQTKWMQLVPAHATP